MQAHRHFWHNSHRDHSTGNLYPTCHDYACPRLYLYHSGNYRDRRLDLYSSSRHYYKHFHPDGLYTAAIRHNLYAPIW